MHIAIAVYACEQIINLYNNLQIAGYVKEGFVVLHVYSYIYACRLCH